MLDFLVKYYDYRPFNNDNLNKLSGNATKIMEKIANIVLPWYFQKSQLDEDTINKTRRIDAIVCMTSFPKRLPYIWLVIECILRQTLLPKEIVLYLSKKQFPDQQLPGNLLHYVNKGWVTVKWVDEDIRSHKKYWYALTDYADTPIITLDDDIIYPSNIIESLYKAHIDHPNCVISNYWHPMLWDDNGKILPYSNWVNTRSHKKNFETEDAFFGSGGGTYFPVGSLNDANADFDIIRRCCPMADDIWLNAIVRKNSYKLFCLNYKSSVPEWTIKENVTLAAVNNGSNKNDEQLNAVQNVIERLFGVRPFDKKI